MGTKRRPRWPSPRPDRRINKEKRIYYFCPLEECRGKAPKWKLANHIHQYHDMHGVESRSALKRKRIATPAEVKAYYPPRIVETQSADIRDLFRQQVPGRDKEVTAASTSKGKGKRKGPRRTLALA